MSMVVNTNTTALTAYRMLSVNSKDKSVRSARLSSGKKVDNERKLNKGVIHNIEYEKHTEYWWREPERTEQYPVEIIDGIKSESWDKSDSELKFHIGANYGQAIDFQLQRVDATAIGLYMEESESVLYGSQNQDGSGGHQYNIQTKQNQLNVLTQKNAELTIDACDRSLNYVSEYRAKIGTTQNRLETTFRIKNTAPLGAVFFMHEVLF